MHVSTVNKYEAVTKIHHRINKARLQRKRNTLVRTVAAPEFDLRGGRGLCQRWGRGGGRKSLKVLKVEVKVILSVFWRRLGHISIKIRLQMIRERSKRENIEKN